MGKVWGYINIILCVWYVYLLLFFFSCIIYIYFENLFWGVWWLWFLFSFGIDYMYDFFLLNLDFVVDWLKLLLFVELNVGEKIVICVFNYDYWVIVNDVFRKLEIV